MLSSEILLALTAICANPIHHIFFPDIHDDNQT